MHRNLFAACRMAEPSRRLSTSVSVVTASVKSLFVKSLFLSLVHFYLVTLALALKKCLRDLRLDAWRVPPLTLWDSWLRASVRRSFWYPLVTDADFVPPVDL